jgi:hypothetical protein
MLLQTEKFYDMLGTGSFAVLALGSLLKTSSMHARKVGLTQTGSLFASCCRLICVLSQHIPAAAGSQPCVLP